MGTGPSTNSKRRNEMAKKQEHITDSKSHQKFMRSMSDRPGIYGRDNTGDEKEDFRRMTAPRATRNDNEHQMAKDLAKSGHLKSAGTYKGRSAWNIPLKGHVGFGLGE
jgi:hypothetical protein